MAAVAAAAAACWILNRVTLKLINECVNSCTKWKIQIKQYTGISGNLSKIWSIYGSECMYYIFLAGSTVMKAQHIIIGLREREFNNITQIVRKSVILELISSLYNNLPSGCRVCGVRYHFWSIIQIYSYHYNNSLSRHDKKSLHLFAICANVCSSRKLSTFEFGTAIKTKPNRNTQIKKMKIKTINFYGWCSHSINCLFGSMVRHSS